MKKERHWIIFIEWFCFYLSGQHIGPIFYRRLSFPATTSVWTSSRLCFWTIALFWEVQKHLICYFVPDGTLSIQHCAFGHPRGQTLPLVAISNMIWTHCLPGPVDLNVSFNAAQSLLTFVYLHPGLALVLIDGVATPRRKKSRCLGVYMPTDLLWNHRISNLFLRSASAVDLCQKLSYQHCLPVSVDHRRLFIVTNWSTAGS